MMPAKVSKMNSCCCCCCVYKNEALTMKPEVSPTGNIPHQRHTCQLYYIILHIILFWTLVISILYFNHLNYFILLHCFIFSKCFILETPVHYYFVYITSFCPLTANTFAASLKATGKLISFHFCHCPQKAHKNGKDVNRSKHLIFHAANNNGIHFSPGSPLSHIEMISE